MVIGKSGRIIPMSMDRSRGIKGLFLVIVSSVGLSQAQAQTIIKLGTIAPEGSVWHDALLETRQRWREISADEVELRIYAGGVLGGEEEMVRKMQRRGLDALAVSGAGLPLIDDIVSCLNIPLLFNTYEELELARGSVAQELESSFEASGFRVLSWAEAGWVHFFSKSPVTTPEDLRELRLWTSPGSPENERMLKQLGFRVVPLPATDMLTGLQTGLIEAIDVPPLFALLDRSYQEAVFMTDLKFAPLVVGTVITSAAWDRLPAEHRPALLASVQEIAGGLRTEVRRAEEEAVAEMVERGLTVVNLDAASAAAWRNTAEAIYPDLVCARDHPALFEKVLSVQRGAAQSP